MNIFDFITQEELEDLPDDDPQAAFMNFVRIAQRRLGERAKTIDETDRPGWEELTEARYGFMNVVVAAAKKYEIEPFARFAVPLLNNFDVDEHRQFKADLDHYMTQLLLDNSSRQKRDSVLITPEFKSTVRTYVFHLRELIEKAADVDEHKRAVLLRRLTEFESELEKKRLNLMAVTVLAVTLAGAPGSLWSSVELANKLLVNILREVGTAKLADETARRLPPSVEPMAITGPRPEFHAKSSSAKTSSADMNDDIPF